MLRDPIVGEVTGSDDVRQQRAALAAHAEALGQVSLDEVAVTAAEFAEGVERLDDAVARPHERKFLGYTFWYAKGGEVKRRVAPKALDAMKERVRELTGRSRGRSLAAVAAELSEFIALGVDCRGAESTVIDDIQQPQRPSGH
jgi:hypothetical protein